MVRSLGAQIGLLAFGVALVAGLLVGNPATVVLLRALFALLAGAALGQLGGWAARLVLRDYLQRRKLEIDQRHFAEIRGPAAAGPAAGGGAAAPGEGG